jgi:hypothetical protein
MSGESQHLYLDAPGSRLDRRIRRTSSARSLLENDELSVIYLVDSDRFVSRIVPSYTIYFSKRICPTS